MAKKDIKCKIEQRYPLQLGVSQEFDNFIFCVAVPDAKECILRIYDSTSDLLLQEFRLEERIGDVCFITLPRSDVKGDCYRYFVSGQELIDPYAKRILGRENFGQRNFNETNEYGTWDFTDFDWQDDLALQLDYSDILLYKLHVRGFTMHSNSGVLHKGTYKGVMEKIPYLKELGVNAVLLMPCIEFNELPLQESVYGRPKNFNDIQVPRNKINFWGYTTEAYYFAPKASYASEPINCIREMKEMVKKLHKNGIEVLLDMHFSKEHRPIMILESLRFWKFEYHIDGFRINGNPCIEHLLATDPFLTKTKLLSSDWDVERIYRNVEPAYRNLAEYNDGFMTDIRRFIKSDEEQVGKFAHRVRKNPARCAVINYFADQNGFTLADCYAYDIKHNEANEENNQDGTNYNYSTNCGVEGKTNKKAVKQLRKLNMFNAITALLLCQGTPMLQAGDEFGNSQIGNNNAYCQDNEIGWVDWKQRKVNQALFEFVKRLIQFRKEHPLFHNKIELKGLDYIACGYPDLSFHGKKAWYPDYSNYSRIIGVLLNGEYALIDSKHKDITCYMIYNMHWEEHLIDIPNVGKIKDWEILFTTAEGFCDYDKVVVSKSMRLGARSIAVLIGRKTN